MALTIGYNFKELGASVKTTNIATITAATTTSLISAPAKGGLIIYQIDWDFPSGTSFTIGDNNAVDGTDRIVLKNSTNSSGSRTFPNGWIASNAKQLQVLTTGTTISLWVRITYMLPL